MTDDSPSSHGESDGSDHGEWPPSNYSILLAIVLLVGAATALVVSTETAANQLAVYAYYALVVGVVLRVIERVGGDRLRTALSKAVTAARAALQTLWSRD